MKVTVTKFLNVRVGKPSVNAPNYQYLAPGTILEIDGKIYEGDTYENNNKWYRDEANNYYWSGGVNANLEENNIIEETLDSSSSSNVSGNKFDFSSQVKKVITNLPSGTGSGISIAVLDSGIDTRFPTLKSQIIKQKNYQSDQGRYPHATQIAGFLVANNDEIVGLCPEASILDLRVANDNGNIVSSGVVKALEDIYKWNASSDNSFCDIVNMSLDIDYQYPKLQSRIEDLVDQGVIVLVAGTNGKRLNSVAKLKGVIPIGTFKGYRFEDLKNTGFLSELVISYLNQSFKTTSNYPNYEDFKDSSAYTALTAGIIAKLLSSQNIAIPSRKSKVLEFLKKNALSIKNETNPKPLTPYTS